MVKKTAISNITFKRFDISLTVIPSSFGINQKSDSLVKDRPRLNKVKDVVGPKPRELLRV